MCIRDSSWIIRDHGTLRGVRRFLRCTARKTRFRVARAVGRGSSLHEGRGGKRGELGPQVPTAQS
eukprot:744339-Alexandrium_andersonii.AAC.1